ncbi:hypothetical protein D5366_08805 [Neokomagataea tanensis]|uniref:Uncharacterized protein n=2 Tax=Neokomagataea tanensis TaxID=661191 RepID=A0A4Y6V9L9_9PROT|nr:hypothetical protein D5366_08805 [Neokomagataea tanensis]
MNHAIHHNTQFSKGNAPESSMKRPLLAAGLTVAFIGMVAYGTHYGPQHALKNGLERFRAALPPGSSFEFSSARPDLLARGAHFTDVTLHVHNVLYRAHELHLGHVTLSSNGEISFTRLDLAQPSIQSAKIDAQANSVHLRGLIIPQIMAQASMPSNSPNWYLTTAMLRT